VEVVKPVAARALVIIVVMIRLLKIAEK